MQVDDAVHQEMVFCVPIHCGGGWGEYTHRSGETNAVFSFQGYMEFCTHLYLAGTMDSVLIKGVSSFQG